MKTIDCSPMWIPYVCHEIGYTPGALSQCIVCREGPDVLAATVYDYYNGSIIQGHILVQGVPCREWWAAIFDYPFNVLKVRKLVGQVPSSHSKARTIDEHFGFVEEARVTDYYSNGDSLIIYTMTREQCVVLNDPKWRRYVEA